MGSHTAVPPEVPMSTNRQPQIISLEQLPDGEGGGKAAGLARLARLGLSVPRCLVVLDADTRNLPEGIAESWERSGDGPAAVRSSGSDEDGEGASAAGQFETFLDVQPADLDGAVKNCLESALSERVAAYEQELSGNECIAMSVVIQEMVRPVRAGVLFSADPQTGDRSVMVVEAVAGLGERLVSGHAEAARYVIDAASGEIRKESGDIAVAALEPKILEELRTGAIRAAADWGTPLDMEWAVDERSGNLRWLQARPITTLADSLDSVISGDTIITRCNIGEMMPGAVTPLTLSTFGRSLSTGLAMYYRNFGAIRRHEPDPSFIESFEDQLFMNLSSMYALSYRVAGASVEATELSILGYVLPPHQTRKPANALVRGVNGIRYFTGLLGWKSSLKKLEKLARGFSIPTEGRSAAEIHSDIMAAQGPVLDRAVALHYSVSAFSGAMNAALTMTLSGGEMKVSEESKALMTELLSGVDGVESAAVLEGLTELADIIRGSDTERILDSDDVDAVHAALLAERSEAGDYYRDFMDRHGFRCIREAELREPEWSLEPAHLVHSLTNLVSLAPRPKAPGEPVDVMGLDLPEGVNKKAVAWLTGQARQGVRVREKSKAYMILAIHGIKLAARQMAAVLESEGRLPEADLAYFLTMEELGDLLAGRGEGLIGRARRRRRLYPERMELRFPDVSWGRPEPEEPPIPGDDDALRGTPVSRGIVEGRVRVVKSRGDAEKLQKDEIMVAQFTDIGWTPFYGRAAGMITEIGGALSHGSVVAREYGLPLVGGVAGACTVLKDGMSVRIDGGRGVVTVLEKETAELNAG